MLNTSTFFDLQEFRKDGSQEIRHISFFPNSTLDFHLWSHREAYLKTESYPQLPAGSFITLGDSKCYVTVPSKKLTNRDWLAKLPIFNRKIPIVDPEVYQKSVGSKYVASRIPSARNIPGFRQARSSNPWETFQNPAPAESNDWSMVAFVEPPHLEGSWQKMLCPALFSKWSFEVFPF